MDLKENDLVIQVAVIYFYRHLKDAMQIIQPNIYKKKT